MKKKNLSKLVAMAVLLGGVTYSSSVWATGSTIQITATGSTAVPNLSDPSVITLGDNCGAAIGVKAGTMGEQVYMIQTGTGASPSALSDYVSVFGIRANNSNVTASSIIGGIDVRSGADTSTVCGIAVENDGEIDIAGLGNVNAYSANQALGLDIQSGANDKIVFNTNSSIVANSTSGLAYGIQLFDTGNRTISELGSITAVTNSSSTAYGIFSENHNTESDKKFSVAFAEAGGTINAYSATGKNYGIWFEDNSTGKSEVLNVKKIEAGFKSGSDDSSGSAYGIYAVAGVNTIEFTGIGSSITAKSSGGNAGGIYAWNSKITVNNLESINVIGTSDVNATSGIFICEAMEDSEINFVGDGSIIVECTGTADDDYANGISLEDISTSADIKINDVGNIKVTAEKYASGYGAWSDTGTSTVNFKSGSLIVVKGNSGSFGFGVDSGENNFGTTEHELAGIKAGFDSGTDITSGWNIGVFVYGGSNKIAFSGGVSFIEAKSNGDDVVGIGFGTAMEGAVYEYGCGTTEITGLGKIIAETTSETDKHKTAYGIYAANANDPAGSDKFSASFADAGGSISAYSANGENYGIKFDKNASGDTGKSEVKNVKTITAGVKAGSSPEEISSGAAYGIQAMAGKNTVTFTGTGSSITAKSSGADAVGISYGLLMITGGGVTIKPAFGITTITDLESIMVETKAPSGSPALSYGIFANGFDSSSNLNVVFSTTGGTITALSESTVGGGIGTYGSGNTTITNLGMIIAEGGSNSCGMALSSAGTSQIDVGDGKKLASIESGDATQTGFAHGILVQAGTNTVSFAGADSYISAKSSGKDAYGIAFGSSSPAATGTTEVTGLGKIIVETTSTDATNKHAYGIYAKNGNTDNTKKFSVSFASAGGTINAYSATGENYGIKFDSGSIGTSEVKNVKTITAGVKPGSNPEEISSGAAYGIYAAAGVNTVAFVPGSSIVAKTSTESAAGISLSGGSGAQHTVTGLGSIVAESAVDVFGIYVRNENTNDKKFSVAFDSTNGGTISAYSSSDNNYGIMFDNGSSGTGEVKNVKTIVAGVKGSSLCDGWAMGICNYGGGTNDVVFKENGSIIAKSNGMMVCGIYVNDGILTVSNLGGTTDGITVSGGSSVCAKIAVEGGTLNLKNSTVKATDDVTTMYAYESASVNLSEGTKVYGPVKVETGKTLTVDVQDTSEWHVNGFSETGIINLNGKMFIEGKDLSVGTIQSGYGDAQLVFDLTGISNGDTILTVTTELGVGTGSTDKFSAVNADKSNLKKGDIITLVDASDTATYTVDSTKLEGVAGEYTITSDDANKKILLTALKDLAGGDTDKKKAPVEGMAAANAAVNTSTDLALGAGMSNLIASTAAVVNNTETFGAASYGKSRLNSGSHVDTRGYGIVVGAGKKVFNKAGNKTTGGLFFEYGNSDFDTYNNAVTGTGKSINKGLGYMMRYDHTCGNYYEGMLHGGKVATNWSRNGSTDAYDMNPTYFGGALTYGHKFMVEQEGQLSVYGSYIYTRTGGGDAKIGEHNYSFGATNSHRTRMGVRYTMSDLMDTKKFRPYAGLAWEHEFNGETTATVRGFGDAPSPSMKGDSGILEFGCKQEVGKWTLGIGVEAFTGKRRGWNGTLQATYNF